MRIKNLSIRLRLTLWYTVILLLILSAVLAGVYIITRNRMESTVRSRVDDGYETVETVLKNAGGDIYDIYHLGHDMTFLLKREGITVYQTQAWYTAFRAKAMDTILFSPYGSWRTPEGRFYKMKRGLIPEYRFELTFAQDVTEVEESLNNLAVIMLAILPFALLCALLGGYILAGRVLSPVNAITRKAREITAERLSERLPVSNPQDEIGHLATVFNDTLARLEFSFERLRRFTADASHELRTPLTSIRSVGEVALRNQRNGPSYREVIGSMLEETERITNLVDNLLTLAREDSGRVQLTPRSLNLTSLVGDVVDELQILAEEKDQALSLDGQSPIMVIADHATIRQAVTNVLHNAIRYTQTGGHIETRLATTDNEQVIIDIIDDGPGIPEAERTKVFERFYRVDKARSRTEGGAGLGLSIARWAVEANQGTIEFCDKEGPGSCCRITLPLNRTGR